MSAVELAENGHICKEHDEQLKYYCETCNEFVCLYCTVKKHKDHNHDSVKLMAAKRRSELKKTTDPVEGMIKHLSEVQDRIEKVMKGIRRQGEEVDVKIDQYYDELLQKLMKQKDEAKQNAHDAVLQKEKAVTTQLVEVASAKAKLSRTKELADALEQGSDQEVLSMKKEKEVIECMEQSTNAYKMLNVQPVESAAMEFVPTKEPFPVFGCLFPYINPHASEVIDLTQHAFVGKKIEFVIITKDSNGDRCVKRDAQVSIQLNTLAGNVGVGEVRDNNDGSYTASFVAEEVGEVIVSVFINGEQIRGSPYGVRVYYRNYQAIDKPSNIVNIGGDMNYPCGVAFGRNGLWAVADWSNHCVYMLDDSNTLLRKFGSNGSGSGQFNKPHGMAFDSHNYLYVVDNGNQRVQKFDADGNFLIQFGGGQQLKGPYGIAVHNDKVYITDYGSKCISMFQTDGQFCKLFRSKHLDSPMDVTINSNDQLLVLDHFNNCIHTFTLDGNYVTSFDTQKSSGVQFLHPYSITTDLSGCIMVADSGNHRVLIFDEDGNFLHCFGCHGSADGQFYTPRGIAVCRNGNIYVTDARNRRVQIFSI